MLSSGQSTDSLNVHSKRKKEVLTNSSDQTKKCKMSNDTIASTSNIRAPHNLEEWLMMFHKWSHKERIIAFDSLVTSEICDVQQMGHLLTIIEPQLQRDFISLLPKELSLYVLSFLDPQDLLRAAQTCRCWRILCEDNLLWREKCRDEGLLEDNETINDLFSRRISQSNKNSFSKSHGAKPVSLNLNCQSDSTNVPTNSHFIQYKHAYINYKNIENNWRYGILNHSNGENLPPFVNQVDDPPLLENHNQSCSANNLKNSSTPAQSKLPRKLKEVLQLKGHEDHVITCLQFNPTSNIIVSGSDDNTLKVWSSVTGRCLRTLSGHTGGVWSSQLSDDNIVISGSTDRTLRVWNALNGHCLHTLYGHTSTVRCMALHGKNVVSGSRDATLRVWNIETGECVHVLVGHVAAVRCVQFDGKICVSGAYDYMVKVWDVAKEMCLHTLEGHTNRVYSLQFDGKHIVSGSLDTSIRVWCVKTGKLKHTLVGHTSLTSGMQLRNNILVSGNADSTVRVWDINTGQCLQSLAGTHKHESAVTCLQFNNKFVISSSDDGTVKLWDLKTGEFIRNLVTLPSGGSGGVVWRIRASNTKLVCAVGSRNGTEETKLMVLDFETPNSNSGMIYTSDFMENSPTATNSPILFGSDNGNSSSSDSLNRFCSNCKQVCRDFDPQQNDQQSVQQVITSIAAPTNANTVSSSNSSSALSSLTSTPSSSNLVLSSISLNSSLQSISSSTSNIHSVTSSTTMAKSSLDHEIIKNHCSNIDNNESDTSQSQMELGYDAENNLDNNDYDNNNSTSEDNKDVLMVQIDMLRSDSNDDEDSSH